MITFSRFTKRSAGPRRVRRRDERGAAMIVALMVMVLLTIFVAASLSRVTTDTIITANAYSHTSAFYAAQAGLEKMSRDFGMVFTSKTAITATDISDIVNSPPTLAGFTFTQEITQLNAGQPPVVAEVPEGPFAGLVSLRDSWRLDATAKSTDGRSTDVKLTRTFYNHLVPIFQFAAFYDGDMEFFPGGEMHIAGRVHTNGNLYLNGQNLHFGSAVTAAGEIVRDIARNGTSPYYAGTAVYVTNGSPPTEKQLTQGSVINGPDTKAADSDVPDGTANTGWESFRTQFNGNLVAHAPRLQLPLQVSGTDPVEIIRRGKPGEPEVLAAARYSNKACIRVSLDDAQTRLPGGNGGIRLDGDANGLGGYTLGGPRGYQPVAMTDRPGAPPSRVNGNRFFTGVSYAGGLYFPAPTPRQTWIKVELVTPNAIDPSTPTTVDVTQDFLSMGVTEALPNAGASWQGPVPPTIDDRAIIKIQRYLIPGPPIKVAAANLFATAAAAAPATATKVPAAIGKDVYTYDPTGTGFNCVADDDYLPGVGGEVANLYPAAASGSRFKVNGVGEQLVPFPIEMYDAREGLFNDAVGLAGSPSTASMQAAWNALYNPLPLVSYSNLPVRGIMSVVDIDVANLKTFMSGAWNGKFVKGLSSTMIPNADGRGLILYVSDRRGDADFDGVYDMENVYVTNTTDMGVGAAQRGEDLSGANAPGTANLTPDGNVQADYVWESAAYSTKLESDSLAVNDHQFYRRAVRLINGTALPGNATTGFTLASENGVYIQGNYNATGAGPNTPALSTPPAGYTGASVPASVVADAITILSRAWNDGKSFRRPLDYFSVDGTDDRMVPLASETTIRAAMLMGISKSSAITSPNQGGLASANGGTTQNLNGGVHNFPRFIENWTTTTPGTRCNYCGSMIGLFYSRVQNGSYKFGSAHIYNAPDRNWTFDTNFLDPAKLPPGTPFLQYVQLTGFRESFR